MAALIGRGVQAEFENSGWGQQSGLSVAVINSAEQIVVAGPKAKLSALNQTIPRGIRIVPMAVTGAFHTEFMRSAQEKFANIVPQYEIRDPDKMVISDLTGLPFTGGKHGFGSAADIVQHLITQVTTTVRWDLVTGQLADLANVGAITEIVELAPAGTLSALLRRAKLGLSVQQVAPNLAISLPEA